MNKAIVFKSSLLVWKWSLCALGIQKWETIRTSTPDLVQQEEVEKLIQRVVPSQHIRHFAVAVGKRFCLNCSRFKRGDLRRIFD